MLGKHLPTICVFVPLSILIFEVQSQQQFAQASLESAVSLPQPPDLLGSQACIRRPVSEGLILVLYMSQLIVHLIFQSFSSCGKKKF